jgi:glycerol-3-phosphate dehydrogenase
VARQPALGRLAEELPFGFARVGDLTVAFDEADVARAPRDARAGAPARRHRARAVGRRAAAARGAEPVARRVAALHAPTAGVVNPYEACFALAESAVRNGVDLRTSTP